MRGIESTRLSDRTLVLFVSMVRADLCSCIRQDSPGRLSRHLRSPCKQLRFPIITEYSLIKRSLPRVRGRDSHWS